jgi:hypothetical protein
VCAPPVLILNRNDQISVVTPGGLDSLIVFTAEALDGIL